MKTKIDYIYIAYIWETIKEDKCLNLYAVTSGRPITKHFDRQKTYTPNHKIVTNSRFNPRII